MGEVFTDRPCGNSAAPPSTAGPGALPGVMGDGGDKLRRQSDQPLLAKARRRPGAAEPARVGPALVPRIGQGR